MRAQPETLLVCTSQISQWPMSVMEGTGTHLSLLRCQVGPHCSFSHRFPTTPPAPATEVPWYGT